MRLLISLSAGIAFTLLFLVLLKSFQSLRDLKVKRALLNTDHGNDRAKVIQLALAGIIAQRKTPHIAIDTSHDGVEAPNKLMSKNPLVLNISPKAIRSVKYSQDALSFKCSLGGATQSIRIPIDSIVAVYANETKVGIRFDSEDSSESVAST